MTPFEKDVEKNDRSINVNGVDIPYWKYAMIIHRRDIKLYAAGLLPTRGWKISDFKKYYGLKGTDKKALLEQFLTIFEKNTNV